MDHDEEEVDRRTPSGTSFLVMRFSLAARSGRTLIASVALALNFLGSGVPILHAAAHSAHAEHFAHEGTSRSHHEAHLVEHVAIDHEAEHPASLHDECLYLNRLATAFALPVAPLLSVAPFVEAQLAVIIPTVAEFRSRAPPPGDPARAPPLV